ncbi:MAG: glycosyltransferase family 4 protein [Candidatus Micrarchaeia archaeon]
MKVGFILPHTQEEFGITTDEEYAEHDGYEHKYAKLINKMGHEATVYYLSHRGGFSEFTHKYGHRVVRVPVSISFGIGRQVSFPLLERIKRDKQDIYHIFSYYALQYDFFALWCFMNGMPFVAQMHGGGRLPNYLLRYPFLLLTLRLAKNVLYVRPDEEKNLRRLFVKGVFTPNWVDESVYRDMGRERKENSLLFVGNISNEQRRKDKGIDVLIRAFIKAKEKNPKLELSIVGRYEKSWAENLCIDGIRLLGHVTTERLVEEYNTCCACVFPSRFEAFPLVALEALACGAPAIITEAFGYAKLLKNEGYGLVVPIDDCEALTSKILSVVEDARERKKNVKIGRRVIKNHFDEEAVGKKLIEIYKKVLGVYGMEG